MSDADIADAIAAVDQIGQLHRGLAAAARIAPLVANARGVLADLDKKIAAKRSALDASNADMIAAAEGEATKRAQAIVDAANADAKQIVANAQAAGRKVQELVDTLRTERDSLRTEITNLKASAKALAG